MTEIALLILIAIICALDTIWTRKWLKEMKRANQLTQATLEAMGYKADPDADRR